MCIQAGGAVGAYPLKLKEHFDVVYTFEPNPILFRYLCKNCPDPQIIKIPCALGHKHQMTHMASTTEYKNNMGAWWVEEGGITPMLCLDDFDFPQVDLVYLDVEGWEGRILAGGSEMIRKHRPTVIAEHKLKIIQKHGDWLDWFKKEFNYNEVDKIGQDICLRFSQ